MKEIYVLSNKSESENGDVCINRIICWSDNKECLEKYIENELEYYNNCNAENKAHNKLERKKFRKFIVENYDLIFKKGLKRGLAIFTKRKDKEEGKDALIDFLSYNPLIVSQMRIGIKYPDIRPDYPIEFVEYIITKVEKCQ